MNEYVIHTKRRLKEILIDSLELELEPEDIEDDERLLDGQLGLDSVSTLILIEAMEDAFGIEVEDEDLTPELFGSITSLAQYVNGQKKELKEKLE